MSRAAGEKYLECFFFIMGVRATSHAPSSYAAGPGCTSSTEPALKSNRGKKKEEKSSTEIEQIFRTRA